MRLFSNKYPRSDASVWPQEEPGPPSGGPGLCGALPRGRGAQLAAAEKCGLSGSCQAHTPHPPDQKPHLDKIPETSVRRSGLEDHQRRGPRRVPIRQRPAGDPRSQAWALCEHLPPPTPSVPGSRSCVDRPSPPALKLGPTGPRAHQPLGSLCRAWGRLQPGRAGRLASRPAGSGRRRRLPARLSISFLFCLSFPFSLSLSCFFSFFPSFLHFLSFLILSIFLFCLLSTSASPPD